MLTPRVLFVESGGFNDENYSVAYNDCDYGFRLTQAGWRHVCVPTAELYHYEGSSRGRGRGNDKISEEMLHPPIWPIGRSLLQFKPFKGQLPVRAGPRINLGRPEANTRFCVALTAQPELRRRPAGAAAGHCGLVPK
jgi:hypothetical protein